jgi:isoquinoline 1-oxidoreductase beta subunit
MLPEGDHAISYTVPNLLVDHAMRNPHVPPGFWRGVNINQNAIYLESFIDELAHAADKDPLAFRQSLMSKHPQALAVLNAVAKKAGWGTPLKKVWDVVWQYVKPFPVMLPPVRKCQLIMMDN